MSCRIRAQSRGGYDVEIEGADLPAFLPSIEKLETGAIVTAAFIAINGGKALVLPNLTNDELLEFIQQYTLAAKDGDEC